MSYLRTMPCLLPHRLHTFTPLPDLFIVSAILHDLHAIAFVKEGNRIFDCDSVVSRDLSGCDSSLADSFSRALDHNCYIHSENPYIRVISHARKVGVLFNSERDISEGIELGPVESFFNDT